MEKLIGTTEALCRRIAERFPGSGLSKVGDELLQVARSAAATSLEIARPNLVLRGLLLTAFLSLCAVLVYSARTMQLSFEMENFGQLIQAVEASFNTIILLGAFILFLVTIETRIKRQKALRALHELRVLSHIVDIHQLTKDPQQTISGEARSTASSPQRDMSPFELSRYLDYCSEMLSIISKIAALYAQRFSDSVALDAVDSIEDLTNGLARKVWQKIMILHSIK